MQRKRLTMAAGLALSLCLQLPGAQVSTAAVGGLTCRDSDPGVIRQDGLFHDGGPLYLQPTAPAPHSPVMLTFRTYACDVQAVDLVYRLTADQTNPLTVPLHDTGHDQTGVYDLWRTTIQTGAAGSLLTYRFALHDRATVDYYGSNGMGFTAYGAGKFAIAPGFQTPAWAQTAIFYQIFPDRFKNGNPKNDVKTGEYDYQGNPVLAQPWTALPENPGLARDFFGGDLAGISQELDPYLKQTLGVTALYLNPIFQSPSNHKYDTQDYFKVDPHFGTNADLVSLLQKAHSASDFTGDYPVRVILDGVFNHTGDSIAWFNKEGLYPPIGAYNTKKSPYYSFYTFLNWPTQYVDFEGCCPAMPVLNYNTPAVRNIIYRSPHSVMQTYLRPPYGIDGWRLDDANELGSAGGVDDNAGIYQQMRAAVKAVAPQALLLGEVWATAQPWLDGTQWDGAMNYAGFTYPVSEWITGEDAKGNASSLDAAGLDATLTGSFNALPRPAQLTMLNSLSTHDIPRFLYRAGGNAAKLGLAEILQMTAVGMPSIYYGDEIGMTGATDPDDRRPFDWNTKDWNYTLLHLTQRLIALRKSTPVLATGSYTGLLLDTEHNGYAFGRWQAGQRAVVVLNDDGRAHSYTLDVAPVEALPGSKWQDALRGGTVTTSGKDTVTVTLGAYSGTVLLQTAP
jgi:alpha-glucosidase